MTWALFLDDERFPADSSPLNWHIARNQEDVLALFEEHGAPSHISFDHDLGDDVPTGYDILRVLIDMDMDGEISIPDDITFYVHSQNPIGRDNIQRLFDNYLEHRRKL